MKSQNVLLANEVASLGDLSTLEGLRGALAWLGKKQNELLKKDNPTFKDVYQFLAAVDFVIVTAKELAK